MKALIHENVALAPLTTFGIGGPARYFIDAASEEAVLESIQFAKAKNLPVFILGGGSNLLVADAGFPGLVIKVGIRGRESERDRDKLVVRVGAGEEWDPFVAWAVESGLAGVECLSGIPGSIGGTPVQNVGAYGQEVSEVLVGVRAYDREGDRIVELSHEQCGFTYRTSIFNTTARDRYVVLQVTYVLTPNGEPAVRYPELQRELENEAVSSLAVIRAAVRRVRARKAMLLTEDDPDCRSAGSFFKNPIVNEVQFADLQTRAGTSVPRYPAASGKVKTAAAWLIEQAGFPKGYSIGPAGLSTKHTLALVNKGGATAENILQVAKSVRSGVYDRFGIRLEPEPVFLGFENAW